MMPPSRDRERLEKRDENRYRFLRALYDITGGSQAGLVNMWDLGKDLGLSREEANDAVEFLRGKYLIEAVTLGGGIGITHAGSQEVEDSIRNPTAATSHFSVQVIHNYFQGPVVNQQGAGNMANVGGTSQANVSHSTVGGDVAATTWGPKVTEAVTQLKETLERSDLPEEAKAEAREAIADLEDEAAKPTPKVSRVKAYLTQLATIANQSADLAVTWSVVIPSILAAFGH